MKKYTTRKCDNHIIISVDGGPELGYSPESGTKIIEVDGLPFKDFGGQGELLPYADWRLDAHTRAKNLAAKLSIEEIAGLMLYSPQNRIPMRAGDTYGGKAFDETNAQKFDLSDGQKAFLLHDNVRHVLVSVVDSAVDAAKWNNRAQALAESIGHGIPVNSSSDPRHSLSGDPEFSPGCGGSTSLWSNMLGLAATFSPETVKDFARIAAREYRLQGIATALSPQADLGTDPRWYRFSSTFGNDPRLVADMTRAYADGFQSPDGNGWSQRSVNTMAKHWPGGGSGEGGRDAHYGNGKYAVYPGGRFADHIYPFIHGAFALHDGTEASSAVMPYYTISYGITDEVSGNSFNRTIITDMLRCQARYNGVVCTDWCITHDEIHPGIHSGKPWGVEQLTEAERHYRALMAGVDQFGGNQRIEPVLEAYRIGVAEHGEEWMRKRMEQSAVRLLTNMFRTGLFENPYVDPAESASTVCCDEFRQKGLEQQRASIIMLKNRNHTLPLPQSSAIFVPDRHVPEGPNYWRATVAERTYSPVPPEVVNRRFRYTSNPADADAAVVFIDSPHSLWMGYDKTDADNGGNGYIPISLMYGDYRADAAREHSIAGGDPYEDFTDRNYRGKTACTINREDMDAIHRARHCMGTRPVIAVINVANPPVLSEIEPYVDAILITFDCSPEAVFDILAGDFSPSGLLPFEMPRSMDDVERHCEDCPHDIAPYTDTEGNTYTFAFGLNFTGPISDSRTARYSSKNCGAKIC